MYNVIKFLQKYKNYYSEYFEKNRLSKCIYGYTCDINQIYCFLGEKNIKESEYYRFYNICKKYFDLKNMKVLDACCGKIPILSLIYRDKCLSIEAIDKQVIIKDYEKIKIYEEDIINFNNFDKFDLVISFRPCFPTEIIINKCIENNINFIIYLCPCVHQGINNSSKFKAYDEWIKYLKGKLLQLTNYDIKFKIDKNMPDDCPIIIGIKKEKMIIKKN